jgi:leucyl/phenylalanyl-tRNA--protein transferase
VPVVRAGLPIEPPTSAWRFPSPLDAPSGEDLICLGGDLSPGTLLAAYRAGLFPMPFHRRRIAWWSPDPRGVIPLDGLRVSRSLRKSCRRFEIRADVSFGTVMKACASVRRAGNWITPAFVDAYTALHRLGWAHSVEAWSDDGQLAGGLYGVAIDGLFAGESMFHRRTDASKVALVALVERLRAGGYTLLDVQWLTPHLESLGARAVPRADYLERLDRARATTAQWPDALAPEPT